MPCFASVSGIRVVCSGITDCGKSKQNPASCYYLLVVKLVVKGEGLLLRIFVGIFFLYYDSFSIDFNSNRKSVNKIVEINIPLQHRKSLYYYFFVINDNKIFLAPASLSSTACSTAYFTLHSIALDSSNKALAFSTFSTIL